MSHDLDWENQRAFLAVFEEGSLSAAARRLGVAQPTVRSRLESLEHALGTVLFIRSVNGMAPTEQARELAVPARAMARASQAFVRSASTQPGEAVGTVRIGVSEMVAVEVLPPMLAALRVAHPRVGVEVAPSNASADLLEQEVDIAVRMHPPKQGALVSRKVGAIGLGFFAHRDYLARRGTPTTLAELIQHDIIGPDRDSNDLRTALALDPALTRERFVLRTDHHPTQVALLRAGAGIAAIHRAKGLADPDLVHVLPSLPFPPIETWVVMHEDLRNVPRVRVVFDHLVAAFSQYAQRS